MNKISSLPNHIAMIMDGNGRWAERCGLLGLDGHRAGVNNIHCVLRYFNHLFHMAFCCPLAGGNGILLDCNRTC